MIPRMKRFEPITGDDLPVYSLALRDVPDGYGFESVTVDADTHPLSSAVWNRLIEFAKSYYRNWEIVGATLSDFKVNLQVDWDLNADTLEKMLEVYDSDIAKPLQSRTIKRTYDITEINDGSTTDSGTIGVTGSGTENQTTTTEGTRNVTHADTETLDLNDATTETGTEEVTDSKSGNVSISGTTSDDSTDFDIPIDNAGRQGTSAHEGATTSTTETDTTETLTREGTNGRTSSTDRTGTTTTEGTEGETTEGSISVNGTRASTDTTTRDLSGTSLNTYTKKGTEVEDWSDVGVAPNYELLNGFLDNNRSYLAVFVSFFKDDFTLLDAYMF